MQNSEIMINVLGMHFTRKGKKKHVIKQIQMKITPWNDDNTADVNFNQKAKDIMSIQSESSEYAT